MDTILITGGSSFLGGYLIKATQSKFNVVSTYNRNLPPFHNAEWMPLDLEDSQEIKKLILYVRPRIIIHNAAMTDVDVCEKQQDLTKVVNIQASEIISKVSRTIGARIFYISTDLVFDGTNPSYSENDSPNPVNYYGWSKWQAELAVADNNPTHVIVRSALMYGPPSILGSSFSEWMRRSWESGKTTNLFIDQFRTTIYAGNLAEAVLELVEIDFNGTIHLAGSERINRYKFGLYLAKQLCVENKLIQPVEVSDVSLKGRRPADVSLQISLAQKLLKTQFLDCREGIRKAYLQRVSRFK